MVVVADKNDGERVKLVDFGIAKDLSAEPPDETTAGHMLGSTAYRRGGWLGLVSGPRTSRIRSSERSARTRATDGRAQSR